MEKQHLTYFKIENFKRFDSFEMSNLGQFNLIVGDNNVGKTSVLEGLTLEGDRTTFLYKLALSLLLKNNAIQKWSQVFDNYIYRKHFWENIFKKIEEPLKLQLDSQNGSQKTIIKLLEVNDLTSTDIASITKQIPINRQPELWIRFYRDDILQGTFGQYGLELNNIFKSSDIAASELLRMNVSYNDNHTDSYFKTVNISKNRRLYFEEGLRLILQNLDEIRPHKMFNREILGVVMKGDEKIYPITQFGDGFIKYVRILLGVFSCQEKRIMIDEIDTGIHFTRLVNYWKTVIQLCDKYQVQLFATTHSLECQQAFIEALEAPEMVQYQKDARNISLIENKKGEVLAVTYDFEQFEYALNIGFNTRGGKR